MSAAAQIMQCQIVLDSQKYFLVCYLDGDECCTQYWWKEGRKEGRKDGRKDGWKEGWMDGLRRVMDMENGRKRQRMKKMDGAGEKHGHLLGKEILELLQAVS
jgi:hypothetical protein